MLTAIARIIRLEPKCRRHILGGIVGAFAFKVFEVFPDILFGLMIDLAFHQERSFLFRQNFPVDLKTIYLLGAAILAAWTGSNFFQFWSSLQWKHAASAVQFRLRMELCDFILNQSRASYLFARNDTLRDEHRATNQEIEVVEGLFNRTLEELCKLLFSTLIVAPILYVIAPNFLLFALIPLLPTLFVALFLQRRVRPRYDAVRMATKRMYREIDEVISGVSIVKDFGLEERFHEKVAVAAAHLEHESRKTGYLNSAMVPLTRALIQIGLLGVLVHGVVLVFEGQLSFGAFAAASFLSRKFLLPFSFLGGLVDGYLKGAKSAAIILRTLDQRTPREAGGEPCEAGGGPSLAICDLSYSYGDSKVLDGLSVEFMPEKLNVIKGPTGVGKTTLLRLLMRDFAPDSGTIHHGSLDLGSSDMSSWRKQVALAPQNPKLFTASVLKNITLFDPHVDDLSLQRALKLSLASTFINDLPQGLDTIVGPNGLKLSGGQMQSVALARAFYSNARVLLLDEPTAAFDLKRERLFLESLKQHLAGKIVILTSHRQQPIDAADLLVELDQAAPPAEARV